eukprot:1573505-Prorocentrum_lima.AAC.1
MTSSLVGSEMCIRDSLRTTQRARDIHQYGSGKRVPSSGRRAVATATGGCLLYTSDAADDM